MNHVAAILAGGKGSRLGADKAMVDIAGTPMIAHVRRALRADSLAVVGHAEAAALLGATFLCDPDLAVSGPLKGVLAALEWAANQRAEWLVTVPCDVPLLPADFSSKLINAAQDAGAEAAHVATPDGLHALCAVWRPSLAKKLKEDLSRGIHRPVRDVSPGAVQVMFTDSETFLNVNTHDDLVRVSARFTDGR
jgi:molybdopterin-guanine dinucleotide biosynthesis protein A